MLNALKKNLSRWILLIMLFKLMHQVDVVAARLNEADRVEFLQGVYANQLKFLCPNGAQERVINTVVAGCQDSKLPVVLYTFANGVGKSTITIHLLLNSILGPQNGWFDYDLFKNWPFPKLAWYCSGPDAIADTITPMIEGLIQQDLHVDREYDSTKDGKRYISKIIFPKQGWTIRLKTFEQAPSEFEAANVGLIINDEPCPEDIWTAQKSRRRMGCLTLLPMTPLYCPPYILEEIKQAADEGEVGYYHLEASIYEACKRRGIRGHLDPDVIDGMVRSYKPDQREARAFGRFMFFSGVIYDTLNRDVHFVSPEFYPITPYSKIIHSIDPHDSRPTAAIYMAKTLIGRFIVFTETPQDKKQPYWDMTRSQTTRADIKEWMALEAKYGLDNYGKIHRVMDKNFGWQTRGQKTFAQLYQDDGITVKRDYTFLRSYSAPANEPEVAYGHRVVARLLEPLADGKPGLVVWNDCYHTWQGLTHYIRKHLTGKIADEKLSADAPIVEKYKDFADIVRYGVCADALPSAPPKPKTRAEQLYEQALGLNQGQNEWTS